MTTRPGLGGENSEPLALRSLRSRITVRIVAFPPAETAIAPLLRVGFSQRVCFFPSRHELRPGRTVPEAKHPRNNNS